MDFLAFDFETANNNKGSVCALGLVVVLNDQIADEKYYLINPEQDFSNMNRRIHGISPNDVIDSPTFPEVWMEVEDLFVKYPIAAHSGKCADFIMLDAAADRYGITLPNFKRKIDTAELSKKILKLPKWNLEYICNYMGICLEDHHNALCDARAAAQILITLSKYDDFSYYMSPKRSQRRNSSDVAIAADIFNSEAKSFEEQERQWSTCNISKTICPDGDFVRFSSVGEKIEYLKNIGILSKSAVREKPVFYNGPCSDGICRCDVVGRTSQSVVLSLDSQLHCVSPELLKEMQPAASDPMCKMYCCRVPIYTRGAYECMKKYMDESLGETEYRNVISLRLNLDHSVSFNFPKQKAFDCSATSTGYMFKFRESYYNALCNSPDVSLDGFAVTKSNGLIRVDVPADSFDEAVNQVFSISEKYIDEWFSPDYHFDCCSSYMECSNERKCVSTDETGLLCCTYRRKLKRNVIFYGKNRNVD